MGSAVSINAKVLAVGDNFSYVLCDPGVYKAIDCSKAVVKGEWFFQPYVCVGGICYKKFSTALEAGDSAIQAVEVQMEDGQSLYLSGTLTDYTAKCNECCGTTPDLTPVAIPAWTPCEDLCADGDGNYIFHILVPTMYSGQTFKVKLFANDAEIGESTALASPAAALTYAQTNWSAQGTWTLVGNVLTLTSTNVICANAIVTLQDHSFCLTVAYPFTFDEIVRSGDNGEEKSYDLPVPVTVANEAQLDAALTSPIDYFSDGAVTHATAGKVQYVGTGRPITLKSEGDVVGTWTTAACS